MSQVAWRHFASVFAWAKQDIVCVAWMEASDLEFCPFHQVLLHCPLFLFKDLRLQLREPFKPPTL